MAKYGKNNYFDGVILPEPKEEMLRRMAKGVKMEYNHVDESASTMFKSPSMPIGTNDFTLEYFGNAYWATKSKTPLIFNDSTHSTYSKGSFLAYGDPELAIRWVLFEAPMSGAPTDDSILLSAGDRETPFHFVVTRKGTTVKAYFNGELKATKKQSAVKDLGDFRLGMANSSNMVMSRIYNYALSAEEVAAHYNDGDPAGYVLPSTMKGLTPVEIVGENSHTWTGADDRTYGKLIPISRTLNVGSRYRISVTVSDYEAGSPFINISGTDSASIPSANGTYELELAYTADYPNRIILYGGQSGTDRRLTLIVNSIEPVGCVAEYLPQNLIPTAEGSVVQWLDSAPQLPEANGILPPLDASVGGYDLAAIGNPKIII